LIELHANALARPLNAREEGIPARLQHVTTVVHGDETRRRSAYSTYGYWLIRRLKGDAEGKSILGLWREIAWNRTGSPIKGFKLRLEDFVKAESSLVEALRTSVTNG
jgi:hypothetical protein